MLNALLPYLSGKDGTEPVPPEPHGFMANVDATLEQNIFTLSKQQWIADVHHNHEADHLGRAIEITDRIAHFRRLRNLVRRLKPIYSDNAHRMAAKGIQFPWWWDSGTIFTKLDVIWGMSA